MTIPRQEPGEPQTPRPAATPFVPQPRPSEEDILELREPYDFEIPERPDGWPIRPPEFVIVVAESDWYKEHFPTSGANLRDALRNSKDRHRDLEPNLEAEP